MGTVTKVSYVLESSLMFHRRRRGISKQVLFSETKSKTFGFWEVDQKAQINSRRLKYL